MAISSTATSNLENVNYKNNTVNPRCQDSKRERQHLSNLLIVYFNWLFFLGVAPFQLRRKDQHSFKICRNYLQMAVSATLTTLSVLSNVAGLRLSFGFEQFKDFTNPRNHFYLASFLLSVLFQVCFLLRIWVYQEKFLNIVNSMQSDHFILKDRIMGLKTKYAMHLLNLFFYAVVLYEPILKTFPPSVLFVQGNVWNTQTILHARFAFFVSNFTSFQEVVDPEQVSNLDCFLAGLYVVAFFQCVTISVSQCLILFYSALTVWIASSAFAAELQKDISQYKFISKLVHESRDRPHESGILLNWALVYEKYDKIRVLCKHTNDACGSLFVIFIASTLVIQATGMDSAFVMQDVIMKIRYIFFIILSIFILILAADVCNKLSTLKLWLSKDYNRKQVSAEELNMVIIELTNRDVGIQGWEKFTITYSHLWNILSTSITYFLLCIQARQESTKQDESLLESVFNPSTS